jgi:Tol biopolymer transport system component/DNA-binding winged helix-turn-helix (wHTH) protein
MSPETPEFYEFAGFRLDRFQKVLLLEGKPVPLTPKVYDTLEILLENPGRLLAKEELMQRLWPDRFVEESNLTSNIKTLRKALGDEALNPRFIETVPRRGYRFIAPVNSVQGELLPANAPVQTETTTSPNRPYVLITAGLIVFIFVFGIAFMWVSGTGFERGRQTKLSKLTSTGKVTNATVAPDGKSIIFSQSEGTGESLWVRRLDTGEQRQLLEVQQGEFVGLSATPDGKYAYYSIFSNNAAVLTLSRVPLDGGAAEHVTGVDTDVSVSFSPDGKKMAYTETHSSRKETDLMVADSEGKEQRALVSLVGEQRIFPFFRAGPVSWSPDGTSIASAVQETDETGVHFSLVLVDPETGAEKPLSDKRWSGIKCIAWKNNDELAVIEFEPNSPLSKIWSVSRNSGEARPFSNDLNGYEWISSAGGNLYALQKDVYSSLHVGELIDGINSFEPKQIFGETGLIDSVGWSGDGSIYYNSLNDGKNEIWAINPNGTGQRRLTSGSGLIYSFSLSPNNDSLVFSSIREGRISLFAADADGQNIRRLTDGISDISPVVSVDGKVIFQRGTAPPSIWSVNVAGSEPPKQLTGYQSTNPSISPDGKYIACNFMDFGSKDPHWKLGLIATSTLEVARKLEFPKAVTDRTTVWNPKTYELTMAFGGGSSNGIYLWSAENGTVRLLTEVDAGRIGAFAWAADGKRLVYSQIFEKGDVIELQGP